MSCLLVVGRGGGGGGGLMGCVIFLLLKWLYPCRFEGYYGWEGGREGRSKDAERELRYR